MLVRWVWRVRNAATSDEGGSTPISAIYPQGITFKFAMSSLDGYISSAENRIKEESLWCQRVTEIHPIEKWPKICSEKLATFCRADTSIRSVQSNWWLNWRISTHAWFMQELFSMWLLLVRKCMRQKWKLPGLYLSPATQARVCCSTVRSVELGPSAGVSNRQAKFSRRDEFDREFSNLGWGTLNFWFDFSNFLAGWPKRSWWWHEWWW